MDSSCGLKIGIDLTGIWRPWTGILVYAAELTRELLRVDGRNTYTLLFSGEVHEKFRDMEDKFRAEVIPLRGEVISKQVLTAARCNALRLDLVHFPALPPPVACLRPFVWTLHDATPWLYPETMDLKGRLYFRWVGAWAARASKAVVTDSQNAKQNIVGALGVPESKVTVIYPGVDGGFRRLDDRDFLKSVRARYGLPEHFILAVGTLEPRKNLPFLVEAYRRFCEVSPEKPGLVIAGRTGWNLKAVQKGLSGAASGVVLTGFVPQKDLLALYTLADVFVLPSMYEGFGFPPLEAMASGCPVIVSNRGSLPEVVGDAALLIDPEDAGSLVAALQSVFSSESLRAALVQKGFARVSQFSWRAAAMKTLELYDQIAGAVEQTEGISKAAGARV